MQEDAEFGRFLVETIADIYGCEPDVSLIQKYVFKYTDCGAFVHFDELGILVGTIVEGSEAETSQRIDMNGIEPSDNGATLLKARFFKALQECEDFANEVWAMRENDENHSE
jgi:hypothetical protein